MNKTIDRRRFVIRSVAGSLALPGLPSLMAQSVGGNSVVAESRGAGVGARRKHGVLSRHPATPLANQEGWHPFFDGRSANNPGVAKRGEAGSCWVFDERTLELNLTHKNLASG